MATLRFFTELAHRPEDGYAPAISVQFDQRSERRFHRIGIRVVTIVNELDTVDFLDLETRFRERGGGKAVRALLQRKAKRAARCDGQDRVLHHVNSWNRQLG